MTKKKVYAVRRGRTTGIFASWDECKAQVAGFTGAAYKGFSSVREARAWLFGEGGMESLFGDAVDTVPSKPRTPQKTSRVVESPRPSAEGTPADYIVYTDGSCLKNPDGPGGYAAVILDGNGDFVREVSGGEPSTTNNRMELRAGIEALRALPPHVAIDFYTDSQYMKNAFTKYWIRNWKRRGWLTASGEPVKNQDLWRALDDAFRSRKVRFHWVRGHAGDRWNERCDALARGEAAKFS